MTIIYLTVWGVLVFAIFMIALDMQKVSALIFSAVISLLLLFPVFLSVEVSTGDNGEHRGYITAIEKSGVIWKNYRVYVKTDNQSSQEDVYCVPEKEEKLISELREISKNRELVTVKYNSYNYIFMSYSNCSGDVIYGFEI